MWWLEWKPYFLRKHKLRLYSIYPHVMCVNSVIFAFPFKPCQSSENKITKRSIPVVVPLLCQVTNSSKWTPITISEDGKRWDGSLLLFLLYCSLQLLRSIAWHLFFQVSTWRRCLLQAHVLWDKSLKVPDGVILDVVAHLTSIRYCRYSLVQFGKIQRVIHWIGLFRKSLNNACAEFSKEKVYGCHSSLYDTHLEHIHLSLTPNSV